MSDVVSLSFWKLYIPYRIGAFSRLCGKLSGIVQTYSLNWRIYPFCDRSLGRVLKHNQAFRNPSFHFARFHTVAEFRGAQLLVGGQIWVRT
jgi:hypothetical protein